MFGTNKTSTDSASSSSSNPLQPSTQLPIAEWNGVRKVCLFQDKNRLAFSTNGRTGDKTSFDPSPYNVHYASNLVLMFKNTIKANLDNDEPNPSSFIPLLTTQDGVQGTAQIVLFGRATPAKDNKPGLLQGIRWGVFYTVTKKEQTLDVVDASTQEYIKWAPPLNLRTSEIMSAYTKQFSIEIENENNGSIKKISLKYQRSWYETKGRSCPAALMDYLSSCEQQPVLQRLHPRDQARPGPPVRTGKP